MATGTAAAVGQRTDSARVMASLTQLLAVPTWIVGPLVVMWLTRDDFVATQARHALNWQLTVGIGVYLAGLFAAATYVLGDSTFILWSSVILVVLLGANILFPAVAAVESARGNTWEYPVAVRVVTTNDLSRPF